MTPFRGKGNLRLFFVTDSNPIRCVITAGPTREPIDPVRYISNASTGKMGYAVAEAAVAAGWTVDLVSGPTQLEEPDDVILYPVTTGEEMFHQLDALFDPCDVLIMTAAVVDFRPVHPLERKEKKADARLNLEMEPVVDILQTVTKRKRNQFVVGFAAETHDLENYALEKLRSKNLDLIAANRIDEPGSGFGLHTNRLTLFGPDGFRLDWAPGSKEELGRKLIDVIARRRAAVPVGSGGA